MGIQQIIGRNKDLYVLVGGSRMQRNTCDMYVYSNNIEYPRGNWEDQYPDQMHNLTPAGSHSTGQYQSSDESTNALHPMHETVTVRPPIQHFPVNNRLPQLRPDGWNAEWQQQTQGTCQAPHFGEGLRGTNAAERQNGMQMVPNVHEQIAGNEMSLVISDMYNLCVTEKTQNIDKQMANGKFGNTGPYEHNTAIGQSKMPFANVKGDMMDMNMNNVNFEARNIADKQQHKQFQANLPTPNGHHAQNKHPINGTPFQASNHDMIKQVLGDAGYKVCFPLFISTFLFAY